MDISKWVFEIVVLGLVLPWFLSYFRFWNLCLRDYHRCFGKKLKNISFWKTKPTSYFSWSATFQNLYLLILKEFLLYSRGSLHLSITGPGDWRTSQVSTYNITQPYQTIQEASQNLPPPTKSQKIQDPVFLQDPIVYPTIASSVDIVTAAVLVSQLKVTCYHRGNTGPTLPASRRLHRSHPWHCYTSFTAPQLDNQVHKNCHLYNFTIDTCQSVNWYSYKFYRVSVWLRTPTPRHPLHLLLPAAAPVLLPPPFSVEEPRT